MTVLRPARQAFSPGEVDGWTSRHGSGHQRLLNHCRIACWALVADAEESRAEEEARTRKFSGASDMLKGAWALMPKQTRQKYLEGGRSPRQRVIEAVAQTAPKSHDTYRSRLWVALDPASDLNLCARIYHSFDESKVRQVLGAFQGGQLRDLVEIAELESLTFLVVAIRLAKGEKQDEQAFELGCDLIKTLALLSAHPIYASCCESIGDALRKLVLNGLSNGEFVIQIHAELFGAFQEATSKRIHAASLLGGGIFRVIKGPILSTETRTDLICGLAAALGTPASYELLLDMMQGSDPSSLVRFSGSGQKGIVKVFEDHPVFVAAEAHQRRSTQADVQPRPDSQLVH